MNGGAQGCVIFRDGSCTCGCQHGAKAAAPTLGDLADWFLPATVARDVGQWLGAQNAQASGNVGAGLASGLASGIGGAAKSLGPWLFASALVVTGGAVAIAIARGGKRSAR